MAKIELVVLGVLLMIVVAPIIGVLGLFFFIFGGFLLFLLAGVVGVVGLIVLIVGLISSGEVTVIAQSGQVPGPSTPQGPQPGYVLCPHCAGQNYPTAVHCQWCGKPMRAQA